MKRLIAALAALLVASVASAQQPPTASGGGLALATFAGGCFWCTEADFDKVDGVFMTVSGYIGGHTKNPTYKDVTSGSSGHTEAVQITFDPKKVSFERLLDVYWRSIDPTDKDGQFCDRGSSYRPEIFVHSPEQRKAADESKATLAKSGLLKQPIVVPITDSTVFTKAEEYHQDFYKKNPGHYNRYRTGCGRNARLEQVWGKPKTN